MKTGRGIICCLIIVWMWRRWRITGGCIVRVYGDNLLRLWHERMKMQKMENTNVKAAVGIKELKSAIRYEKNIERPRYAEFPKLSQPMEGTTKGA
jgi:hypothetical protein